MASAVCSCSGPNPIAVGDPCGPKPPPPPVGFYGRPLYPVAGAPASTTVIVDHQRGSSNFGDVAVGMAAGAVMGAALSNLGGSSGLPVFLLYKKPAASWRCFFLFFPLPCVAVVFN